MCSPLPSDGFVAATICSMLPAHGASSDSSGRAEGYRSPEAFAPPPLRQDGQAPEEGGALAEADAIGVLTGGDCPLSTVIRPWSEGRRRLRAQPRQVPSRLAGRH
jgi:hypothetical protein